WRLKNCSVPS
ncbi:hypothetical protein CFOL_v3_01614, partial [Cephalotus follicularis]